MNFILVISICSFLISECLVTSQSQQIFATWKDCVDDAIHKSQILMASLPIEQINDLKLATTFSCHEINKTET